MKQWKKSLVCILVIVACVGTMTACNFTSTISSGSNGLSAYEIAVRNGFVGTEQEWLASLKTPASDSLDELYDSAVEHGYTGTYLDFLKEYLGGTQNVSAINRSLLSVVSIVCEFDEKTQSWFGSNTQKVYSSGSGVIYELDKEQGDAYIVTNYHVVYDVDSASSTGISDAIGCYLYGMELQDSIANNVIGCTYVGGSMTYDLAVLKVENSEILKNSNAQAVEFADSNDLCVGEQVYAIGNPEGEGIAVSSGVVCVDSESIVMTGADNKTEITFREIRTDATVNPGNSGGGLFNAAGELVGVVNAKIIDDEVENVGYAIPSTLARYVVENLLDHADTQKVQKALIGVQVAAKNSWTVYDAETGLTRKMQEVAIQSVESSSIGRSVLKAGDVIRSIRVGDTVLAVTRTYQVVDFMLTVRAGDTVVLTVERNGETLEYSFSYTEADLTTIA